MLTATQRKALAFVGDYYNEHGLPPAIRDVAASCNMSVGNAHRVVVELTEAGYLERRPFRSSVSYWPTERGAELVSDLVRPAS
jgi:DNA-binding IclR family transcriptional regulator